MKAIFMITALAAAVSAAATPANKVETTEATMQEQTGFSGYGQVCGWYGGYFYYCQQGLVCEQRGQWSVCDWQDNRGGPRHGGDQCNPNLNDCPGRQVCEYSQWRQGYFCNHRGGGGGGGGRGGPGRPGDRGSPCNNDRDCQRHFRCRFNIVGGIFGIGTCQ